MINNKGFTMIELLTTLLIISILTSVAVVKFIDLSESADKRGIEFALAEFNSRISLKWGELKLMENPKGKDGIISHELGSAFTVSLESKDVRIRTNGRIRPNKNISISFGSAKIWLKSNNSTIKKNPNTVPAYHIDRWE